MKVLTNGKYSCNTLNWRSVSNETIIFDFFSLTALKIGWSMLTLKTWENIQIQASLPLGIHVQLRNRCEFFTPVFTGGFSMESKRQQISPDLQNSSNYSCWFLFKTIWDRSEHTTTISITFTFVFHNLFSSLEKIQTFFYLFIWSSLHYLVHWNSKTKEMTTFCFLLINSRSDFPVRIEW